MADADFSHGNPTMNNHTPSVAVAAGEVVDSDVTPLVAHNAIEANRLGSLSSGGGVYGIITAGVYVEGALVYWDDTAKKVTTTATSNEVFGKMVEVSTTGGRHLVHHMPTGLATADA